jgi:mono/diheme cytochrome c family protein
MKRLIAVIAGLGFLAVSAPSTAQDKVQEGSALFSSQKCVLCHTVDGKGNKKGPLDDAGARLKADEIRAWITTPDAMREKTHATRTPAMKDMKLAKDQVDALVAFLLTKKAAAAADAAR